MCADAVGEPGAISSRESLLPVGESLIIGKAEAPASPELAWDCTQVFLKKFLTSIFSKEGP